MEQIRRACHIEYKQSDKAVIINQVNEIQNPCSGGLAHPWLHSDKDHPPGTHNDPRTQTAHRFLDLEDRYCSLSSELSGEVSLYPRLMFMRRNVSSKHNAVI